MPFKPRVGISNELSGSKLRVVFRQVKAQSEDKPESQALFQTIDQLLQLVEKVEGDVTSITSTVNIISNSSFGTYTPTLTNVANLTASTAFVCFYTKIGNVVHVNGTVDVNPTAAGVQTQLGISLPLASLLSAASQCAGVAQALSVGMESAAIIGDATNDRAQLDWIAGFTGNQKLYFNFAYEIF